MSVEFIFDEGTFYSVWVVRANRYGSIRVRKNGLAMDKRVEWNDYTFNLTKEEEDVIRTACRTHHTV